MGASCGSFQPLDKESVWDRNKLLFTYIHASRIMAYDPETGETDHGTPSPN